MSEATTQQGIGAWIRGQITEVREFVQDRELIKELGDALAKQNAERTQPTDTNPPGTTPATAFTTQQSGLGFGFTPQQLIGAVFLGGLAFIALRMGDGE